MVFVYSDSTETVSDLDTMKLRIGMLCYCRFIVREVPLSTQVRVVVLGAGQVVVAAPAASAISASSYMADPDAYQDHHRIQYAYAASGLACAVLFICVDSEALTTSVLPRAIQFEMSDGNYGQPTTRSLVTVYHGFAREPSTNIQTFCGEYYEARVADRSSFFFCNSVLLIPDFLTQKECRLLKNAADQYVANATKAGTHMRGSDGMQRLPTHDLGFEADTLSTSILRNRVLPFFEQHWPHVAQQVFGQSSGLQEMDFTFGSFEPAINRYTPGGTFHKHTDDFSVTVLVLLSDPLAFTGAGTFFYPQSATDDEYDYETPLLLRPSQGTCLIWNGNIWHSASAVQTGIRHVLVASFDLKP